MARPPRRLFALALLSVASIAVTPLAAFQRAAASPEQRLAAALDGNDVDWINSVIGSRYAARLSSASRSGPCRLRLTFTVALPRPSDSPVMHPPTLLDLDMRGLFQLQSANGMLEIRRNAERDLSLIIRFADDRQAAAVERQARDLARRCGARMQGPPPLISTGR